MAVEPSALRVAAITVALTVGLLIAAMFTYFPTVPRGVLTSAVLLGALPIWAMVRGIDQYAALRDTRAASSLARTAFVAAASAAIVALVGAVVYVVATPGGTH